MKKLLTLCFLSFLTASVSAQDSQQKALGGLPTDVDSNDKTIATNPTPSQADIYNISVDPRDTNNPFSVTVWVDHHDNTYRIGDKIVISAKAKRNGYLTLINVNASGEVRQIFPNRYQPNQYLRQGETITIPSHSSNFDFTVTGPVGKELIKAFITDQPVNIFGRNAANLLTNEPFPLVKAQGDVVAKTIVTTLREQRASGSYWGEYNKFIYVVDRYTSGNYGNHNPISNAAQEEQALRLTGLQIRDIQRYLRSLGYYKGSVDGTVGQKTRQAILQWQRDVGLTPTGYINDVTFARLQQSI